MMYFLKTTNKNGNMKVLLLQNQKHETGVPLRSDWEVKMDQTLKTKYDFGTKFVCTKLLIQSNFYEIRGDVRVLVNTAPDGEKATKDEWEAYGKYMKEWGLPQDNSTTGGPAVETLFMKMGKNEKYKCPTIEDDGYYVNPDDWLLLIRNINNNVNTMLLGPTGAAKTELAELVFKKLKKPMEQFDMSVMTDPIAGLIGVHRLHNGQSVFDYSRFIPAIKGKDDTGYGILLDEFSRAPAMALNLLLPVLDRRRTLFADMASGAGERVIKVHENTSVVATANVGSKYTGTFNMDRAMTRRFFQIEVDYPPELMEVKLYEKRSEILPAQAKSLVKVLRHLRGLEQEGQLSEAPSVAEGITVADLVRDGYALNKALEKVLFPLFEGTKDEGERHVVANAIAMH